MTPPALHRIVDGYGPPRVVLVHGFTQTAVSWDPVVAGLSRQAEVVRVELPGHGRSGGVALDFAAAAAAIGRAGGPANYVGYSMGGRLCLALALDRPHLVQSLVLVGASPGIEDATERAGRAAADEQRAVELEEHGVPAFLQRWVAQPLFGSFRPVEADLRARQANRPHELAAALRSLGTGSQPSLWHRLGELTMPVLLVAGDGDQRFAGIALRMASAMGASAMVATLGGAHAVHLEQVEAFCALVREFWSTGARSDHTS